MQRRVIVCTISPMQLKEMESREASKNRQVDNFWQPLTSGLLQACAIHTYKHTHTTCIFNSLTPRSDQYVNSPYIFNTVSSREVTRMKKIINYGIWS